MRRFFFTAIVAIGWTQAIGSASFSAEPAGSLPPSSTVDWTGFHVGLRGGYGWNDNDLDYSYSDVPPPIVPLLPASADLNAEGALLGGAFGSDWQFGRFVVGIEGDIAWSSISDEVTTRAPGDPAIGLPPLDFTTDLEMHWFATARGRAGLAFDRLLVYGTGGLAFAELSLDTIVVVGAPGAGQLAGSVDDTKVGWTAGGGVQFALTDHVDLSGEALYYDLGRVSVTASDPTNVGQNHARQALTGVIGRAGINWRF